FTTEINNVRRRITESSVEMVAMACHTDSHFTAFVYHLGHTNVEYGDSLHGSPPFDILPILQWIFGGLAAQLITGIVNGVIRRQGLGSGEGSCGVACHNFIERAVNARPGLNPWSGDRARIFRDAALEDLLQVNHIASLKEEEFHEWVVAALSQVERADEAEEQSLSIAVGFRDFNMYIPMVSIVTFNLD
ncbi:hypothetical protein CPB83DRAFT_741876, partial [Crepidotus variabilis]